MRIILAVFLLFTAFLLTPNPVLAQQKRIYLANDDHTDYMWTANESTYRTAFKDMITFYLNQINATAANASPYQSRFNIDGSFWAWVYEQDNPSRFPELISRLKDGHLSMPLNGLVSVYGGQPAEAVIRNMYYPGRLERQYNLRLPLVIAMENATVPYGLGQLWAGSGAKYTWKGVCCSSVPGLSDRQNEVYWWQGQDNSRILTKWYSIYNWNNSSYGGYAEARVPDNAIAEIDAYTAATNYPYNIYGAFGQGWDDLKTMNDSFINAAKTYSNSSRQIIVSNEIDFFQDMETTYGSQIPNQAVGFGNEWDLFTTHIQEVSSRVKRSVEKLRAGEALATLVALQNPAFTDAFKATRDTAYFDLGLFWEHCGTQGNAVGDAARLTWLKKMASTFVTYSDKVYNDSLAALPALIKKSGTNQRFFVLNPLTWTRTDYADFAYTGSASIRVVDVSLNTEVPFQIVTKDGQSYLRILASNLPSLGYKVYEIQSGVGTAFSPAVTITNGVMENTPYKVTVSTGGVITSLLDKNQASTEFAASLNALSSSATGTRTTENVGPVSGTVLVSFTSPINRTARVTLYKDINRIDIQNDINQNYTDQLIWSFGYRAATIPGPVTNHEEVGAVIKAALSNAGGYYSTQNAVYKWLTLNHFVDQTGSASKGISLSNWDLDYYQLGNSTFNSLDTNTAQVNIVAGSADGSGYLPVGQGGETQFRQRFALMPHGAYNQTNAMKMSLEHQNPLVTGAVTGSASAPYPETSYSLLTISDPDVLGWAVKPHEDGIAQGVVVRTWNQSDSPKNYTISFPNHTVTQGKHVTHIETDLADLTVSNGSLQASAAKQQLKTHRVILNNNFPPTTSPTTPLTPTSIPTPTPNPYDIDHDNDLDYFDFRSLILNFNSINSILNFNSLFKMMFK